MTRIVFGLATLVALVACITPTGTALGSVQATIYYGNNATYGSSATNPSSLQGFTRLRDRWIADGLNTVITNTFNPTGKIFFATAPQNTFTASQVSSLQTFLAGGGLIILSQDGGGAAPVNNQLMTNLGSSMQMTSFRSLGTVQGQVVGDTHPLMAGLPNGSTIYTYSPGTMTGGQALVDYPVGTHFISVESVGGGHVLGVADFDILNNVPDLYFPAAARPNIHQFWDNIAAFAQSGQVIPEPSTFAVWFGLVLAGLGIAWLRKR